MSTSDECNHPGWRRHLAPSGGPVPLVGWTAELHGPDGRLASGITPTVHELTILAHYWAGRIALAEAVMADSSYDAGLARIERVAEERLREIAGVLGPDRVRGILATARAIHGQWTPARKE
jgi:hypothetical protein